MSNMLNYAMRELELAGFPMSLSARKDDDDYYAYQTAECVYQLLKVLGEQGHSGMSIQPVISLFTKLARYQPLSPLTGADDEWLDVSEASGCPMWQNKRASAVFKDERGAYYLDAVQYVYPDGRTTTGGRHPITFPYTPTTKYIPIDESGMPVVPMSPNNQIEPIER